MRKANGRTYIEKGNCYLKMTFDDASKPLTAFLCLITDVYSYDGFSEETYDISSNSIDYEDAGWSGTSTEESQFGKNIPKTCYDKWVNMIRRTKCKMYDLVYDNSHILQRPLKAGDIVSVELNNPYDLDQWKPEDSTEIYQILDIRDDDKFLVKGIDMNLYSFQCIDEPCERSKDYDELIKSVSLIDSRLFEKLISMYRKTTSNLIAQIYDIYKKY